MSFTQAAAISIDRNGRPLPMIPAEFGDIIALQITVSDSTPTPLSDATDYPDRPELVGWILENVNSEIAKLGDANVDLTKGVTLVGGTATNPGQVAMLTDPGKTYLYHEAGGDRTYNLTLLGKHVDVT